MSRKWILALVAVGAAIAGCGNPVRQKVEDSVAKSLPDIIGPADSYKVTAYGPTLRMMKGKLDGLDIEGRNVRFPNGMSVSRLDVKIRDIVFDTGTKTIKKATSTEYSATLSEAELNRYLTAKYPSMPGLKVTLNDGTIGLAARPGVSVLRVGMQADAGLEIRDERILALNLKKLKFAGIGVPGFLRDYVDSKLDTIFDANDLGFDARIKTAAIERGSLTLSGDLDLMKMAEKSSTH